jgi:transcriptional regulator with XRE-family HTH domain
MKSANISKHFIIKIIDRKEDQKAMENPILEFRKAKGWSRVEFLKRSGFNCQTLRDIEIGATKRIKPQTQECLSLVGIGPDIQEQLNDWHRYQLENRRNGIFDSREC